MKVFFGNKKVSLLLKSKKASKKVYSVEAPKNIPLITSEDEKLIDSNDLGLVIRKEGF